MEAWRPSKRCKSIIIEKDVMDLEVWELPGCSPPSATFEGLKSPSRMPLKSCAPSLDASSPGRLEAWGPGAWLGQLDWLDSLDSLDWRTRHVS